MRRSWGFLREPVNSLSHMIATFLAIAGMVVLLVLARGRPIHVVSFAVYGVTLTVLFAASTIYHTVTVPPKAEAWFQKIDYIAIFCLIAGSYMPIGLVALGGVWGWSVFGVELGLAILGILAMLFWRGCPHWVRVVLYVAMGWGIVIAIGPLRHALPDSAMAWLFTGGALYTVGVAFYATDKPILWKGHVAGHEIWHIFVLLASICHYCLIVMYMT